MDVIADDLIAHGVDAASMTCPACHGTGEYSYFAEIARDEKAVTMKKTKEICEWCNGSGQKPMSNADRIRTMSDEELVASDYLPCPYNKDGYGECKYGWHAQEQTCEECKLECLKQPAEGCE